MEVSPKSGLAVREMCRRVAEDGGAALIADYGEEEGEGDTFRAFKKHRYDSTLLMKSTCSPSSTYFFLHWHH